MSGESITDVMVKVHNLLAATRALEDLGMYPKVPGDGWTLLEHSNSGLTIVLTDRDFGSPCAISIGAPDLRALTERLNARGWLPDASSHALSLTHITFRHPTGLVAVAYTM